MALTVEKVHTYAKDNAMLNILLDGAQQSSDDLVTLAMELAASDFNALPPLSAYSVDNFPNDAVLLYGTLHHLANSEAERQLRNQADFDGQGIRVSMDNKQPAYTSLASYYAQLFTQKAKELKHHLNMEEAWGAMNSPYSRINEHNFRS